MPSQRRVPLPLPCLQQVGKPEVPTLLRLCTMQGVLMQSGTVPCVFVTHLQSCGKQACKPLTLSYFAVLAGLLLIRCKTLARKKKERQLHEGAALACVAPGDKQVTKTKAIDLEGSQESSDSDSKPARETSWQLWELVTGSAAITDGQHSCMSFYNLRITSLVHQGSVSVAGSQYISLGPDDANMKHEDITLCRNEQGRPIKLGQGGFGKVSLFTVSPNNTDEVQSMFRRVCCCRCTKP